jgi:hypothetical protein
MATETAVCKAENGTAERPKKKKKGVTWVIQATTSQRNPGCTEKRRRSGRRRRAGQALAKIAVSRT